MVIAPARAGLEGEGQLGESVQPLLRAHLDRLLPGFGAVLDHRLFQRTVRCHHPVAGLVGQQIAHRDRSVRGHGVGERRFGCAQDLAIGEFGQPVIDRIVQRDASVLHEPESCDGEHRFRHRLDAEDRVVRHISGAGVRRRLTDSAADDEDARRRALRDVTVKDAGEIAVHASSKALIGARVNPYAATMRAGRAR